MLQRFERAYALEIRNGIMFDFLPGTATYQVRAFLRVRQLSTARHLSGM